MMKCEICGEDVMLISLPQHRLEHEIDAFRERERVQNDIFMDLDRRYCELKNKHDSLIAELSAVKRLLALMEEALREQRRHMAYPDLPAGFPQTMVRMIDRALEGKEEGDGEKD